MALLATFGSMTWVVEPSEIDSIEDVSTSYELESVDGDGIHLKPQPVTLTTTYLRSGRTPNLNELIARWRAHVGVVDNLVMSDYNPQIAPVQLRLEKVDVSDLVLDAFGRITKCTITLTFKEPETSNETAVVEESTEEYAEESNYEYEDVDADEEVYSEEDYVEAVDIGASEEEKEAMKPFSWGDIDPQYEGLWD